MSYNNLEILKMTISDFYEIKPILHTEFDDFWNDSIFENELKSENSYYLIAKQNDEIVGFIRNEICNR